MKGAERWIWGGLAAVAVLAAGKLVFVDGVDVPVVSDFFHWLLGGG